MNKPLLLIAASLLLLAAAHAQTPPSLDCEFFVSADDSFELFINGESTWKSGDYQNVVKKTIPLRRGDVVVFTVTDQQGGLGGHFAAVILRDNEVVASSKDFRYTVDPAPGFTTSPSVQKLRAPDLEPLQKSFGLGPEKQPKRAWTQKSDRNFAVVHFKHVVSK